MTFSHFDRTLTCDKYTDIHINNGTQHTMLSYCRYKNTSGDEIVNVNFYAVHPEATRIR